MSAGCAAAASDQATGLAERLGMAAHFCPCVEDGCERYGIATLSRWQVAGRETIGLPRGAAHPRSEPPAPPS